MPANLPARVMHHPGTRGLRRGPYSPAATDGSTRGTQMESFDGRLAVVTGGGTGMGRELVLQLAAAGASVATCDLHVDALDDTAAAARAGAPAGVKISTHACDVSDESQMLRFRAEVLAAHAHDHVNLVFNTHGISGGAPLRTLPRTQVALTFSGRWR